MIELSKELEIEDKPDLDKVYEFVATITYSIYYNQQTNYGVYEFTTNEKLPYTNSYMYKDKTKYLGCLSGNMQELYCEADYKINAKLKYNKKYNKYDYQIQSIFSEQPKTLNEQRKFLEVLCTKRQADILLESYPNIIEDIMTGKYIDTSKFKGIGDKTFNKIKDKILENYVIQDILVLLRPLGVTFNTIKKMLGIEDNPSLLKQKIIENPYMLTSVHGLGFKKVDDLALKLVPELRTSLQRTKAFLVYIFKEIASSEGHTWINKRDLIGYVRKDLRECIDVYKDFIEQEVENPTLLYIYDEKIGLLKYYNTAKNIVERLFWLDSLESMIEHFTEKEMDDSIKKTEEELGFEFTSEQKNAIKSINKHNVIIVTAPAGSGKSVSIKGISDLLSRAKVKKEFLNSEYNQIHSEDQITEDELFTYGDLVQGSFDGISVTDDRTVVKVGQSALSAKAAKRMKEVSGQDAMTMHRMLGYSGGGFAFKKDFPMKYHVNVLDEASMINKSLINSYINAIRPHGKLIIIFDFAQLPPIGSGDFARDILKSKLCINKFTKVYRQGEKSGILMDANKIRIGVNPIEKLEKRIVHGELKDMFYRFETDKEKMRDMAIEAYLKSVKDVGLEEAVIVTPRKRKCVNSANEINKIIQDKIIPDSVQSLTRWKDGEKCIFKLGAKVIQKKNNYEKDKMVFNGDEGYITDINKNGFSITFGLENGKREVRYTNSELNQIELSYCNSVHACLTNDTLLLTDSGILELKDLDDNTKSGEIIEFDYNIKVYNGNELENPSHFINNGLSECKKITTQRGYNI
ncbi:MAG: ATP-dependent RecD-like DNA helicase, partial [Bacilli bacterium]|nr:ATP-dependent RecD-like DNA helicase [Bacilli bacterium]